MNTTQIDTEKHWFAMRDLKRANALLPAYKQLSEADLKAAGVTPTLLRISLGLENVEDIIEDFEQAFAQAE